MFKILCGRSAFQISAMVITRWDSNGTWRESCLEALRDKNLKTKYEENMADHGSDVEPQDAFAISARSVTTLLCDIHNTIMRSQRENG